MIRTQIGIKQRLILNAVGVATIFLLYAWLCSYQKSQNPDDTLIPNATQFYEGLFGPLDPADPRQGILEPTMRGEIPLVQDIKASAYRLFWGVVFGVVMALGTGLLMGCFTRAEAFGRQPVAFFSFIPPTAMIAVYFAMCSVLAVDFDPSLYVAMIAIGIFPVLSQNIFVASTKDVPDNSIYKSYTLGASTPELIWDVVIPMIKPRVITAIRLAIPSAVIFLIAAEYALADTGFGYRLRVGARLLNMAVVFTCLIILGTFGFVADQALKALRRKLCPWYGD